MERGFRYIQQFVRELRRRQVLRTTAVYAGTSFALLQVTAILVPAFRLPSWTVRLVVVLLALGFPVAVGLAWTYNVTEEGVARVSAAEEAEGEDPPVDGVDQSFFISTAVIVGLLMIAVGLVLYPRLVPKSGEASKESDTASTSSDAAVKKELLDRSVAVLPFEALGQNQPGTFTEGIHDGLLVRLSNVASLNVISQTTVQKFRDTSLELPAIADSLRVRWVVEGGVQRVGKQVRVNVQLIDPRTDTHAWAQNYQRDLSPENLFAIQSEITKKVAQALRVQLSPEETERVERRPTDNLTAYRYYVQGRRQLDTRQPNAMREAVDFFQQALRKDSAYALAWSGLADAVALSDNYGYEVPVTVPSALDAARRALAIDSTLAEAHASLGLVYIDERQSPPAALRKLRRAVALRHSYAQAHHWLGELLLLLGRPEQARRHAILAVNLNPGNADARRVLLDTQLAAGDAQTALATARRAQRKHPDYSGSTGYMGWRYRKFVALVHLQRYEEALQVAEETSATTTGRTADRWHTYRALVQAQTGTPGPAQQRLTRLQDAPNDPLSRFHTALLRAALGNKAAAFRAFEQVAEWVDGYKTETLRYHYPVLLGPLRESTRYDALLRAINEAWGLQPGGHLPAQTGSPPDAYRPLLFSAGENRVVRSILKRSLLSFPKALETGSH